MFRLFIVLLSCSFTYSTVFAAEFSADIVTQGLGSSTGKIYYKDNDNNRSEAMGMINIIKAPNIYQLVTDTKKYTVQKLEDLRKKNPMSDYGNIKDMIKRNNLKKVGKEKIQGFKCIIYEGTINVSEQQPAIPTKIWYSKELSVAVRQEMTLAAPMGKIVSGMSNIKLGKQDKNLFKIPADYKKVNSLQEAMGVGSLTLPTMGGNGSKSPSKEDMKKMMEQMQEMIKKNQ